MNEKLLRGVLVDVENEKFSTIEIPDNLYEFYKILKCDCIDIVVRRIGGKRFNIICDDIGLFKNPQKISAINNLGQPQLVGNLFIVGGDTLDGDLIGLTDQEALHIVSKVQKISTHNFPAGYPMLTQCEY